MGVRGTLADRRRCREGGPGAYFSTFGTVSRPEMNGSSRSRWLGISTRPRECVSDAVVPPNRNIDGAVSRKVSKIGTGWGLSEGCTPGFEQEALTADLLRRHQRVPRVE